MAVTGGLMLLFVVGHLAGNLQVFAGDNGAALDKYALTLKGLPALMWGTRIVMGLAVVFHVWAALSLKLQSYAARPVGYKQLNAQEATLASRTMFWGGLSLGFYILYHLMHLTLGVASPISGTFNPNKVYLNLIQSFQNVPLSIVYILGMVALGMHLYHGFWSLFQTLGLNHPAYMPRLRMLAKVVGVVIGAGFSSIPVAILAQLIK